MEKGEHRFIVCKLVDKGWRIGGRSIVPKGMGADVALHGFLCEVAGSVYDANGKLIIFTEPKWNPEHEAVTCTANGQLYKMVEEDAAPWAVPQCCPTPWCDCIPAPGSDVPRYE